MSKALGSGPQMQQHLPRSVIQVCNKQQLISLLDNTLSFSNCGQNMDDTSSSHMASASRIHD